MNELTIKTLKKIEVIDITKDVEQIIRDYDYKEGFCLVYTPHSTVALVVGENEKDLMKDYERTAETLLLASRPFSHCGHGVPNAEAHIFGALHGCSVILPIENNQLKRGKFQSILFFELDGPRERQIWIYAFQANPVQK